MAEAFKGYKRAKQVLPLCLEVKIQRGSYNWCIYRWKCKKQGTTDVFRSKNLTSKIRLTYLKVMRQH